MPTVPDAEHSRMVTNWQKWRITVAEAMDTVHDALEGRDYTTAHETMMALTQEHAKMSVRMTNVLIRNGLIQGDMTE